MRLGKLSHAHSALIFTVKGSYYDALGNSCGRRSRHQPLFELRTQVSTTFQVENTRIYHSSS